jgi:hypothetical protein
MAAKLISDDDIEENGIAEAILDGETSALINTEQFLTSLNCKR